MSGNTEIVKLLLEYNADPHTCDAIYGNALHLATCFRIGSQNHAELVKLLLINGADPNRGVVNSNGVMLRSPVVEYFRRLYKHSVSKLSLTEPNIVRRNLEIKRTIG
jgi:ankyrin repeat protein